MCAVAKGAGAFELATAMLQYIYRYVIQQNTGVEFLHSFFFYLLLFWQLLMETMKILNLIFMVHVEVQPNIITVNPSSSIWGILSNSTQGMNCLTCKYGNYSCSHCSYVVQSIDTEGCPDFVIDFFQY